MAVVYLKDKRSDAGMSSNLVANLTGEICAWGIQRPCIDNVLLLIKPATYTSCLAVPGTKKKFKTKQKQKNKNKKNTMKEFK